MKIKDFKCICGHDDFFFGKTLKKGIYCAYCGKWFKWANKDEQNLDMQEPILDKIRVEIEQIASRYTISRERAGMGQVEWEDRLVKEVDVLQIIDKYKSESEDKE